MRVWIVCTEYDHEPIVEGVFVDEKKAIELRDSIVELRNTRKAENDTYMGSGPVIIGPAQVGKRQCWRCSGSGLTWDGEPDSKWEMCSSCDGEGWV